jgi:hypothetical protein
MKLNLPLALALHCLIFAFPSLAARPSGADIPPLEEPQCPDTFLGGYGPFDYSDPARRRDSLPVVETYHFNSDVAALKRGVSGTIGSDLDYTIRAFPNHHRALDALSRYGQKLHSQQPPGTQCTIDGFFRRAVRMAPGDATLHMVYGIHLSRWGHPQEALAEFKAAEKLAPNDPNILYNLGLGYFEQKDYENARVAAVKAYENGFPPSITGLKDKLMKAGKWSSPG